MPPPPPVIVVHFVACPTRTLGAVYFHPQIAAEEWMASNAMSFSSITVPGTSDEVRLSSSLPIRIFQIVGLGAEPKMHRIHAWRVVT